MIELRAFDALGLFVEPAVVCLLVALVVGSIIRRILDWIGVDRFIWNRALFDLAAIVAVTASLILALRFPGS